MRIAGALLVGGDEAEVVRLVSRGRDQLRRVEARTAGQQELKSAARLRKPPQRGSMTVVVVLVRDDDVLDTRLCRLEVGIEEQAVVADSQLDTGTAPPGDRRQFWHLAGYPSQSTPTKSSATEVAGYPCQAALRRLRQPAKAGFAPASPRL